MKTIHRSPLQAAILGLPLLVLAACGGGTTLEPAPGATAGPGDAAMATVSEVRVTADPGEWPGSYEIASEVTPIQVTVDNNGNFPVRVRYSEMKLVAPDGRTLTALPPYRIEGTAEQPVVARGLYDPIASPAFTWNRFSVAPYYATVYPNATAWNRPFAWDPLYYDNTFGFWEQTALPTPAMLARALPEGVVEPGGEVTGFVYFEDLDLSEDERVGFRFDIVNARTGREIATASMPFVVDVAS